MTRLDRHPILMQAHELVGAIEECGASVELTSAVVKASALLEAIDKLLDGEWLDMKDAPKETFILIKGKGLGNHINGPDIDICLWDGKMVWNEGGTELAYPETWVWQPLPV